MTTAQVVVEIMIWQTMFKQNVVFVKELITLKFFFKSIRKEKEKSLCGWKFGQQTNVTYPSEMFRCGSEDHLIEKFLNPQKENEKLQKQVCFNEEGNCAYENVKNKNDQKYIYIYGIYVW